jgi:hypothetical protein
MSSVLVEDVKVITWKTVHVIACASALLRYWPYIWTLNGRAEDYVNSLGVDSQAISREGNGHPVVSFQFWAHIFAPWRCCTLRLQFYSTLLRLSTRAVVAVVANPVYMLGIGDTSR